VLSHNYWTVTTQMFWCMKNNENDVIQQRIQIEMY
jgi:hypothetical protein